MDNNANTAYHTSFLGHGEIGDLSPVEELKSIMESMTAGAKLLGVSLSMDASMSPSEWFDKALKATHASDLKNKSHEKPNDHAKRLYTLGKVFK